MSLFVTSTGSDVGKTVVCALLAHRYATRATPLHYWKPVATGISRPVQTSARRSVAAPADTEHSSDSQSFEALTQGVGRIVPEAYRFEAPVAPHWAARKARTPITLSALSDAHREHQRSHGRLLIEGIGGLLVPLNERGESMADWLVQLRIPCVVVAHTGLGTLNHTLLTLEALRHRDISIAGVVLCGPSHPDNRQSLAAFGKVPIIDSVGWLAPLSVKTLARAASGFDALSILAPYLTPL